MNPKWLPLAVALAGAALVAAWFAAGPAQVVAQRRPGADVVAGTSAPADVSGPALGKLEAGPGHAPDPDPAVSPAPSANLANVWPTFRGARLDGIGHDSPPLLHNWPAEGPTRVWSAQVGEGHAGAAIRDGRVYLLDYDRIKQADVLRCMSLADGQDIWRYSYPVKTKRNHGMSRTIPTLTDKYVITLGPKCHVAALDRLTGQFLWGMDLVKQYHAKVPQWYAGQCPLVDGDKLILAPGGDCLMMAVEPGTGKIIWQTPNPDNWQMTHGSVVPMDLAGRRMYVYCASGGVVGVSADSGQVLWKYEGWKISIANVPTPVVVGDGKIFLCGGYNAGSMMLQVKADGGTFSAEPVFTLKASVFGSAQHTPILYEGHLYGVRPEGDLVCLDLSGKVVWSSGGQKFGIGPYLLADGVIFVLNDTGSLSMVEASATGYRLLGQFKALTGSNCWAPMAIAGGRLILRDGTDGQGGSTMVCLSVGAGP